MVRPAPGTVRIAEWTGVEMLRIWLAWFIGIAAIAAPTGVAICHFYETVETVVDPCLDPPVQEVQSLTRVPDSADSALFSLVGVGDDQRQARGRFCDACFSPAPVYLLVQTPPPRV
jgi:hypothetical protein